PREDLRHPAPQGLDLARRKPGRRRTIEGRRRQDVRRHPLDSQLRARRDRREHRHGLHLPGHERAGAPRPLGPRRHPPRRDHRSGGHGRRPARPEPHRTGVMSVETAVGTAERQGRLWSVATADWAEYQEPYLEPAFRAGLDAVGVGEGTRLLDVGCGAGLALRLAADRGADVNGLDAAPGMLEYARRRVPGAELVQGEIQSLPFADDAFDAVTGFNSFQYAADPVAALREARRVTVPGGRILVLVWSPAEMCQLAPHLQSLGALMPPPPPGAPGPFALCGRDALQEF